jgi:hypothetical protein
MTKRRVLTSAIVVVLAVLVCTLVRFQVWRGRDTGVRMLAQDEIGPMFKQITGTEFPVRLQSPRAIAYDYRGISELYAAADVDEAAYSRILEKLGGKGVETDEFPQETKDVLKWDTYVFDRGNSFVLHNRLGAVLFRPPLYQKVQADYMVFLSTGQYPHDAIRGHNLRFSAESEKERMYYDVLMFADHGIAYIAAGRSPKGVYFR